MNPTLTGVAEPPDQRLTSSDFKNWRNATRTEKQDMQQDFSMLVYCIHASMQEKVYESQSSTNSRSTTAQKRRDTNETDPYDPP